MNPKHPKPKLSREQLTAAWQTASLVLDYPDGRLLQQLPLLQQACATLPDEVGAPLRRTVDFLATTPVDDAARQYVETFDNRKRCCLFLTYFVHGDTRKRGVALLRFKQAFRKAGLELTDAELPDHLCVLLEFGATANHLDAWGLLLDHRAGLELLRIALRDQESPWAGAVEAVTSTLPPLRGDEMDAVRRLAAQGPPDEEVGLSPYGSADLLPPPAAPIATDIGMPAMMTNAGGPR
ncbi:MAG TPA: nitrate reductase molybdenum cofactor assembly chaperone [Actinomycetales bacterium]|nr:nitrate reductase molybdenum cofactor assembly chaperone [Actinomycetales bacterium]